MTTAPEEVLFETTGAPLDTMHERPDGESLSLIARGYMLLVLVGAAAVTLPFVGRLPVRRTGSRSPSSRPPRRVAQLFMVRTPSNQSYHTTIVFLVPAALILPPQQLPLLVLLVHIPEWLKYRYRWPLQTFNIADYIVAVMAAWGAAQLILDSTWIANSSLRFAVAGLTASAVLVLVNHALLAVMLYLAYGHSARATGLFSFENLSTELVLAALGVAFAYFWLENPWLIPFAIAPILLVHRSLTVPALQAEARVDPKTGLFNARHFALALQEELGRAERFQRPLSLIMADLDLLRDINNNYGHLAGDAVLKGIAEVFRAQLRHYDIPARFGGEEFSILLPETPPEQALEIAERIRRAVADRHFDVETSSEPIRATISIGVAGYPKDGTDPNELIHQADLAVYRAKLQGRNRVLGASSEPLLVPAERTARLVAVPEDGEHHAPIPAAPEVKPESERRHPRPHAMHGPRFLSLSPRLAVLVGLVSVLGIAAGVDRDHPRPEPGRARPRCDRRARRDRAGARARVRRGDDLRRRGRCDRRSGAVRAPRRARDRRHDLRGRVERSPLGGAQRALQHRRAHVRVARRRRRVLDRERRQRPLARSRHGAARARSRVRCTSRSTCRCSASPSRWKATSGGGRCSRSVSHG